MITDHKLADELGLTPFERSVLSDEAMQEIIEFFKLTLSEKDDEIAKLTELVQAVPNHIEKKLELLEERFNSRGSN